MTTETQTETTVHPWERAGLGQAPYRYVGSSVLKFQACQGAPIQCGGSCDYCGMAICNAATFESADGKRFKTGLDCARRAGAAVKQIDAWQRKHDAELRAAAKARKAEKARADNAELLAELEVMAERRGFAGSFAGSVARQIKSGKAPSARQLEVIARLRDEA